MVSRKLRGGANFNRLRHTDRLNVLRDILNATGLRPEQVAADFATLQEIDHILIRYVFPNTITITQRFINTHPAEQDFILQRLNELYRLIRNVDHFRISESRLIAVIDLMSRILSGESDVSIGTGKKKRRKLIGGTFDELHPNEQHDLGTRIRNHVHVPILLQGILLRRYFYPDSRNIFDTIPGIDRRQIINFRRILNYLYLTPYRDRAMEITGMLDEVEEGRRSLGHP